MPIPGMKGTADLAAERVRTVSVGSLTTNIKNAAPDAVAGARYNYYPIVEGLGPYTYSLSGPAGLSLNPRTGHVFGTPQASGPVSVTASSASGGVAVPTNRIRNSTNTGYVLSRSGGYSTYGAPTYA